MRILVGAALIAASVFGTVAQAAEVFFQGGTQGVGVGFAQPLTSWAGVHADINGFGLSHKFSAGNMDYDGHVHLISGGTYLDLFPIKSSAFRVTAGLLFNNDYLRGDAVSHDGTYNINGTSYAAPGATVSVKVKYPTVMPYLGLGFGHKPEATRGLGFTADIGVAYGRPRVDYNVSPDLVAIAGADNVNAEEQEIRNSVNHYRWYPIVQLGLTYRF